MHADLPSGHTAHFWRTDDYATGRLAAFVRDGRHRGKDVLVMATARRWSALGQTLHTMRAPFEAAIVEQRLLFRDADPLKELLVARGWIDEASLREMLSSFLTRSGARKRIYGEIVALLANDERLDLALALERAGHSLAAQSDLLILCGYDGASFRGAAEDAIADVAACHDRSEFESVARMPSAPVPPRDVTVLLADDYEDTRELFREYLEFRGYRVVLACDGVEALEQARSARPHILLDFRMPRLSGTEAMLTLKADRAFSATPIIARTGARLGQRACGNGGRRVRYGHHEALPAGRARRHHHRTGQSIATVCIESPTRPTPRTIVSRTRVALVRLKRPDYDDVFTSDSEVTAGSYAPFAENPPATATIGCVSSAPFRTRVGMRRWSYRHKPIAGEVEKSIFSSAS
jgi:CheY-like chemotaxis protein